MISCYNNLLLLLMTNWKIFWLFHCVTELLLLKTEPIYKDSFNSSLNYDIGWDDNSWFESMRVWVAFSLIIIIIIIS